MTIIESRPQLQGNNPDYALSQEDRKELFSSVVAPFAGGLSTEASTVFVVNGDSDLANYVRSVEADALPTIPEVMAPYDAQSRFALVLRDPEEGVTHDKPAHVFRLNFVDPSVAVINTPTGLPTFDDALKLGLVTEEELLRFYQVGSLRELGRAYVNVESNISVEGANASRKRPYGAIGFRAIFELVDHLDARGVVAYQNPEAMRQLDAMKLISTPLVGNPEISVLDEDKMVHGTSGGRYYPLTVEGAPHSKLGGDVPMHNRRIFSDPDYARSCSRVAGMLAKNQVNVLYLN